MDEVELHNKITQIYMEDPVTNPKAPNTGAFPTITTDWIQAISKGSATQLKAHFHACKKVHYHPSLLGEYYHWSDYLTELGCN